MWTEVHNTKEMCPKFGTSIEEISKIFETPGDTLELHHCVRNCGECMTGPSPNEICTAKSLSPTAVPGSRSIEEPLEEALHDRENMGAQVNVHVTADASESPTFSENSPCAPGCPVDPDEIPF